MSKRSERASLLYRGRGLGRDGLGNNRTHVTRPGEFTCLGPNFIRVWERFHFSEIISIGKEKSSNFLGSYKQYECPATIYKAHLNSSVYHSI